MSEEKTTLERDAQAMDFNAEDDDDEMEQDATDQVFEEDQDSVRLLATACCV